MKPFVPPDSVPHAMSCASESNHVWQIQKLRIVHTCSAQSVEQHASLTCCSTNCGTYSQKNARQAKGRREGRGGGAGGADTAHPVPGHYSSHGNAAPSAYSSLLISKAWYDCLHARLVRRGQTCYKNEKENFTLFSDHNNSLLRRQPGAKPAIVYSQQYSWNPNTREVNSQA